MTKTLFIEKNQNEYTWRQRRLAEVSYMIHCMGHSKTIRYTMELGCLSLSKRMIKSKVLSVPTITGIETINNQDN